MMKPIRSHKPLGASGLVEVTVKPPEDSGFDCVSIITLTASQFQRYAHWLDHGGTIQQALPELSPETREQLLSGITPQAWDEAFGDDD